MTALLMAAAIGVGLIVGAAIALPCPACRKRKERLRAAYTAWKARGPR